MSTTAWTYAQRLGGTYHADGLIAELREGVAIGIGDMSTCPCATPMCSDCVAGIAAEVLRELLTAERV